MQPQHAKLSTIFPFWVTGGADKSPGCFFARSFPTRYAQDSTMFARARGAHPDIWKRKLDLDRQSTAYWRSSTSIRTIARFQVGPQVRHAFARLSS